MKMAANPNTRRLLCACVRLSVLFVLFLPLTATASDVGTASTSNGPTPGATSMLAQIAARFALKPVQLAAVLAAASNVSLDATALAQPLAADPDCGTAQPASIASTKNWPGKAAPVRREFAALMQRFAAHGAKGFSVVPAQKVSYSAASLAVAAKGSKPAATVP